MNTFASILIWIAIVVVLYSYYKKRGVIQFIEHHIPVIQERIIVGYKKKFRVMNSSEAALFFELKKQLPQYFVFPNMRLADVVSAIDDSGYFEYKKRIHKILPKHIDFVICDRDFKPKIAIELNGDYHKRYDQMEKDEEKRLILAEAKLPFKVIHVKENFAEAVQKIKAFLV